MTARRSSSSCLLDWCVWIFRAASNRFQLIFGPYQHYLLAFHNRQQEVVFLGNVLDKILLREDRRVDLTSDSTFHPSQRKAHVHRTHVSDQHHIHVASRSLLSAGYRAVDEADPN